MHIYISFFSLFLKRSLSSRHCLRPWEQPFLWSTKSGHRTHARLRGRAAASDHTPGVSSPDGGGRNLYAASEFEQPQWFWPFFGHLQRVA